MESQQSPNLPLDIAVDILRRLPLKSRSRFKCVSKPWFHTILDPKFNLSIGRKRAIIISSHGSNISLGSVDNDGAFAQELPPPWKRKGCDYSSKRAFLLGSCNGLLLIGLDESIFLWNPTTKYFTKVLTLYKLRSGYYTFISGFCYDPYIDDYKAVFALCGEIPSNGNEFVIIASLKSKRWMQINFPYDIHSTNEGPVVNGLLHWIVSDTSYRLPHKIAYFNPLTDEFNDFPIPMPDHTIIGLGDLGGCLCMARNNESLFQGNIEVMVMKEYGVNQSWTTLFTLSNSEVRHYAYLVPLFFTENGEVLMLTNDKKLLAYDPKENSQRNIPILNIPHSYGFQDATFEETVVSPTCYRWKKNRHRRRGRKIQWKHT